MDFMTQTPIDAETRGGLNLWLQRTSERYTVLDQLACGKDARDLLADFLRRSTRTRAFLTLQRIFRGNLWDVASSH
jgi:hypothetical protein